MGHVVELAGRWKAMFCVHVIGLMLLFLTVSLAANETGGSRPGGASETIVFDGYRWGIHAFEMTITRHRDGDHYAIRKKDLKRAIWSNPVVVSTEGLAANEAFSLVGSIKNFPSQFESLSRVRPAGVTAFGWPDSASVYAMHRTVEGKVDGKTVIASYWARRDGSAPMDLIFDDKQQLIAAVDVFGDNVIVRRGYESLTSVAAWSDPQVSQPVHGYRDLGLLQVKNRTGIPLATRVYLPDTNDDRSFPTIFIRTPYGISDLIDRYQHYAVRGYAVVLQAAQGTAYWDSESRSDGDWGALIQEPADGADALDWIVSQPWSNGSICMQGASYVGYTQWSASMARHPALKCLVPEVSMGTAFSDQPYMGGTFVEGMAYYAFWMLDKKLLPGREWSDVLQHRPLIDMDVYATGEEIPVWNRFFEHWRNDDFWKAQDWYRGDHDRNIATLQISGWFDDDYPGTRSNWALMARRGTKPNRLILGPWKHNYNVDRRLNGYSYGETSLRDDIWLIKQKWYDHFLKNVDNDVTATQVEYFVLGSNQWRKAGAWPPAESVGTRFFFHSDGNAATRKNSGVLDLQAPVGAEPVDEYRYDPKDPVQNWYSFDRMTQWSDMQRYQYDFKDIETRSDVAVYTSEPMEMDTTMAGNIKVVLYASADVKDTDWWVYVSDVSPDNSSNRLSVGALRARFRNLEDTDYHVFGSNFEQEKLLSGKISDVVRYEISIPSIANTFKQGHRIRVAVMNSHANYSFPNSNTGGDEGRVSSSVVGTLRIHHSRQHPSHVILPIMPN